MESMHVRRNRVRTLAGRWVTLGGLLISLAGCQLAGPHDVEHGLEEWQTCVPPVVAPQAEAARSFDPRSRMHSAAVLTPQVILVRPSRLAR